MCNFVFRLRDTRHPARIPTGQHALVNRVLLDRWRAGWFERTGQHPTNADLLAELDKAINEYNQSPRVQSV